MVKSFLGRWCNLTLPFEKKHFGRDDTKYLTVRDSMHSIIWFL